MIAPLLLLRAALPLATGTLSIDGGPLGPVEVVWSGCDAELRGPVCLIRPGAELVVWTRVGGEHSARCDRQPLTVTGSGYHRLEAGEEDGGCWTRLQVDDPHGALELRAPEGRAVWALPFAPKPARDPILERIVARARAGDHVGARRRLAAELPRLQGDPLALADGLLLAAKLAFPAGDDAGGTASITQARALYTAHGWLSEVCAIDLMVAHYTWTLHRDADAAMDALQAALPCVLALPQHAFEYRTRQADILEATQQLDAAWAAHTGLDVLARRLRDTDRELTALTNQEHLAEQLHASAELRRIDDRFTELDAAIATQSSCTVLHALNNHAWTVLLRHERGGQIVDTRPTLTVLRHRFADGSCADPSFLRHATIHLALAAVQQGDHAQAEALLLGFVDIPDDPENTLWHHRILARAGLARSNLKLAAEHTSALADLAHTHPGPMFAWHADFTRGALAEADHRPDEAIAAYLDAEARRDEMVLPLALGAGRERLVVDWDAGTQRLVALQRDKGDLRAALRTVRLARRRPLHTTLALAQLGPTERAGLAIEVSRRREVMDADTRQDADRTGVDRELSFAARRAQRIALRRLLDAAVEPGHTPSPALREPAPGELLLVFYPLGGRWIGLADDGTTVTVADLALAPDMSDERLGAALYTPFADAIAGAREVRLLASGFVLERDLHGLPFRGEPLLARVPVAYSLDLDDTPDASILAGPRPLARGAVVAANPGGEVTELDAVPFEADAVERALNDLGLLPRRMTGADATRQPVLRALADVDILHFSGHNLTRLEAAGSDHPWDLELRLEGGTRLGVEDVLLAPADPVPRVVILSACATGKPDPRASAGGLGIGPAFLPRGADLVVATARPVVDAAAALVAAALYDAAEEPDALADPATLAAAQRDLLADGTCADHRDICAYRAWAR